MHDRVEPAPRVIVCAGRVELPQQRGFVLIVAEHRHGGWLHARRDVGGGQLLARAAEEEKIPFTIEASARATGTDADAVHLSRGGVPTALVSIPIRYMHSPVELVQLDDVHAAARLIAAAALRLDVKTSFAR